MLYKHSIARGIFKCRKRISEKSPSTDSYSYFREWYSLEEDRDRYRWCSHCYRYESVSLALGASNIHGLTWGEKPESNSKGWRKCSARACWKLWMCCCVNNTGDGVDGVLWILLTEPESQKPGCLGLIGIGKKIGFIMGWKGLQKRTMCRDRVLVFNWREDRFYFLTGDGGQRKEAEKKKELS